MSPKLPIDILTDYIVERSKVSLIKVSFDNIIYESNPQNVDFDDLPFDGNELLITWQKIYCFTNNIIERLKVSSIKQLLYNIMYKINPRNSDFDDLPFDGDERLVAIRWLYRINDESV